MHEVVHLSFGPPANELNALFYNRQQSYFVYSKEDIPKSHVDPGVRFVYGAEYTPRAAFWDYRNGFSKWRYFNEKYEEAQTEGSIVASQERPVDTIPNASTYNHSSWVSRVKVPLHPATLHTIPDWEFDAEKFPFGHQRGAPADEHREFEMHDEGISQFNEISSAAGGREEYLDVTLRPLLEKCDLLDGINVVTDLSGWAGLTAPYLEALRDEYVPKSPIFTWTISQKLPRYKPRVQQSRLEALAQFAEFSSLLLPLQDALPTSRAADFTTNAAEWLDSFESTCLLSSLRRKRTSMHELFQDLTIEVPNGSIVQLHSDSQQLAPLRELDGGSTRVRNTVKIARGSKTPLDASVLNHHDDRSQNLRHYWVPQSIPSRPSLDEFTNFNVSIEMNDAPLKLRKLTGHRSHELRELVYDLTEPYVWGWDEPSDDDFF